MFYKAIAMEDRYFGHKTSYKEVMNEENLTTIVNLFADRMTSWYIEPIQHLRIAENTGNGHFGFAAMALNCILIDTLSQFEKGEPESTRKLFKEYARDRIEGAEKALPNHIKYEYHGNTKYMKDYADVLYNAFRCGILHQAHILPCGMIEGNGSIFSYCASGYVLYADDDTICPSVTIDPWALFGDLQVAFDYYIKKLKCSKPENPTENDALRDNFKSKFKTCFGIDIGRATL